MSGQLCWLSNFSSAGKLTLHLRQEPHHPWKPHTAFPELCIPDYPIPGGSRGWATSQRLLQNGWTIVPTEQARSPIEPLINISMDRFVSTRPQQ
jgi:hypothetical protein